MITSALAPGKTFLASIAFAPVEVKVKQEENAGEPCVAPVEYSGDHYQEMLYVRSSEPTASEVLLAQ